MKKILEDLMNKLNEIHYGYVVDGKNIYPDLENDDVWDKDFSIKYRLESPEEIIKSKYGVCWDQVELERYYLEKQGIKCTSYFIVEYNDIDYPTHTFIVTEENNKYYWFEHSWFPNRGIHEYDSLEELLKSVKQTFCKDKKLEDTVIYEYKKPNYGINSKEFFSHCESGKRLSI